MYKTLIFIPFLSISSAFGQSLDVSKFDIHGFTQGTTYAISYYDGVEKVHKAEIDSLFHEIDLSMSLYIPESTIKLFNDTSADSIVMDRHMQNVVAKSFEVNKKTGGLFDITIKPLTSLWGFSAEAFEDFPSPAQVDSVMKFVGMDKLKIAKNTLYKKQKGVQIDLDGIAQGYSVDAVADYLTHKGVDNFIVEIGGEIVTRGTKPYGEKMRVAIRKPLVNGGKAEYMVVELEDFAITTSGNYERSKEFEGRQISHHMNPATGYPVGSNIISVTVVAPSAIEADAYDNVFMAMTPSAAVQLAEQLKGVEIYIFYAENGDINEMSSSGFEKYISGS